MEWVQLKDGDWQAEGEIGKFLLWKSGRSWTGRYYGNNGKTFPLPYGSLKKIKGLCEDNFFWEEKAS